MPIDETSTGWVTSDGLLYLTTDAAARAQAELDLKVENSTLIERGKEGLRRLRKRMEKTTPSQEPVPAAVGKVRMEIVDDFFARWITTNGDSFDNMEEAVLYQEALDVAERGGWATDPEAMRARLGLPLPPADLPAVDRLQRTLDAIDAKTRDIARSVLPARPLVAPGTYSREIDKSLFSTVSTERLYTTYQPPVVDVSSALPREELRERVQRLQRRLSGKVEPEAVELYTQSVESKRRVKLKPRGGG